MKYTLGLWISIFLLFFQAAFSQNPTKIDSLKKLLTNDISAKEEVDIYNLISEKYGSSDSSKVLYYSQKAINLAQKIDYPKGRVDAYYHWGWLMLRKGYYEEATEIYEKSLEIAKKNSYPKGEAMALRSLGIINNHRGNYEQALKLYQNSLEKFKEAGDKEGTAYAYSNIGIIYKNQGDYEQALTYYQKSQEIFEEIKNDRGLAYIYNNIGLTYKNQGKYAQSLEYYQKSLKLFKKVDDKRGVVYAYNNIGIIYKNQENYEMALEYYQKSLDLRLEIADKNGIANVYISLGKLALADKDYKKAQNYFEKSLSLREEMGEDAAINEAYINLGIAYFYQKNEKQALIYLEKGMQNAFKIGTPNIIKDGEYLAKVYEAQGNYKKAYQNYVLFKQMSDSLINKESIRRVTQLEEKYNFNKLTDSLQIVQEQEKTLLNAEIKQRQFIQIATFIGLILLASFLIVLFVFYRSKQKSNLELNEANEEIKNINTSLQRTLSTVEKQRDSILDSINYARNIQRAALPLESEIKEALKEYFILFKPRDVVSGDFYWFEEIEDKKFIVVADCTGHGVPGAFMTMLGIQALTDIIIQKEIYSPDKILNNLDSMLRKLLKSASTKIKDGMDIGICVIDKKEKTLCYAGAKSSLIIIQEGVLKEVRGNFRGINGEYKIKEHKVFTSHSFDLSKKATFYLYSDGYQDQFGGKRNKKFMKKRFREFLYEIYEKKMTEQKKILEETLNNWMEGYEQVDDILVMGIRPSFDS